MGWILPFASLEIGFEPSFHSISTLIINVYKTSFSTQLNQNLCRDVKSTK